MERPAEPALRFKLHRLLWSFLTNHFQRIETLPSFQAHRASHGATLGRCIWMFHQLWASQILRIKNEPSQAQVKPRATRSFLLDRVKSTEPFWSLTLFAIPFVCVAHLRIILVLMAVFPSSSLSLSHGKLQPNHARYKFDPNVRNNVRPSSAVDSSVVG